MIFELKPTKLTCHHSFLLDVFLPVGDFWEDKTVKTFAHSHISNFRKRRQCHCHNVLVLIRKINSDTVSGKEQDITFFVKEEPHTNIGHFFKHKLVITQRIQTLKLSESVCLPENDFELTCPKSVSYPIMFIQISFARLRALYLLCSG